MPAEQPLDRYVTLWMPGQPVQYWKGFLSGWTYTCNEGRTNTGPGSQTRAKYKVKAQFPALAEYVAADSFLKSTETTHA